MNRVFRLARFSGHTHLRNRHVIVGTFHNGWASRGRHDFFLSKEVAAQSGVSTDKWTAVLGGKSGRMARVR